MNQLRLSVRVIRLAPLRHTPAGVAVQRVWLAHESEVIEAGQARRVVLELQAVALGDLARALAAESAGGVFHAEGFLAPIRRGSERLVFHLQRMTPPHELSRQGRESQ